MPEMPTLDPEMRELLMEFLASGGERAGEFETALAALEASPGDKALLSELRRHFHRLAGAGAIYDIAPLSALGRRGEDLATAIMDEQRLPTASEFAYCRQLIDQIRREFGRQAGEASTAPAHTLTVVPGGAAARQDTEAPSGAGREPGTKLWDVLVVDEDATVQQRLVQMLNHYGISHVRVATNRAEATAELERRLPDGAIVDRELPDGTGYDVVRDIRTREHALGDAGGLRDDEIDARPPRRAPVIILSLDGFLDNAEAIRAGADACFERPTENDWESIVRKMQQFFDRDAGERPRVLMVEDDSHQSRKVRRVLERAGYEVRVCDAPRTFDEVLSEYRPDLILMDIDLPDVNGFDLAKYVRQDDQYVTLPIVFLSSRQSEFDRVEAVEAGGDAHLVKPVKDEVLIKTVSARLERARLLKTLLNRDGLTRLLTHSSFMDQAQAVVARKRRERGPAALAMIDIDHFKSINDTYGHQAGDRVLVSLATLLRRSFRRSDIVGRYGGEEFGLLLDDVTEQEATGLLMRLLHEFSSREHRAPDGTPFRVTFSAGVASLEPATMDLQRWIEAADASLYVAKRSGRNRVVTNRERLERLRIGA
jgi:diguanylate cyclase (GGDEF)-like protein